jgi:hypothetical protein
MTLLGIVQLLISHKAILTVIIIVILSSIEILPIKLNPWSWLIKGIRKLNGTEIIEKKLDNLENKVDEGQAITSRARILRFGDELRIKIPHSKESYDQILDDIKRYNQYCIEHPKFENDKTVLTSQIIETKYKEHLLGNTFL